MARTYTLNATIYGGRASYRSELMTSYTSNSNKRAGFKASTDGSEWYYCCYFAFDQATLADIKSKISGGVNLTSIKLKISSGTCNYQYTFKYGLKATSTTTAFKINTDYDLTIARYASIGTIDVTSKGVPDYGYVIGGWQNTHVAPTISSATLTIETDENEFVLSYDANGGTDAPSPTSGWGVSSASVTVTSSEPTRTGYSFVDWNTDSDGSGTSYDGGDSITISEDTTIFAQWNALRSTITSAPSTEIGQTMTVTFSAQIPDATHTVSVTLGSTSVSSGEISAGTYSSTLTIPSSFLEELPTTTSGEATVQLNTYVDGALLGTDSAVATLTVASTEVPDIQSFTVGSISHNATIASWHIRVQGYSNLVINSAIRACVGTTLVSAQINGSGNNLTVTPTGGSYRIYYVNIEGNPFADAGVLTYTMTVTDSRGRTSTVTGTTGTVYAYSPPTVTSFTGYRCDSDGTLNPVTGESLKATVGFSYSAIGSNAVTNTLSYKKSTEQYYTTAGTDVASGSTTIFAVNSADQSATYNIQFTITDSLLNTQTVNLTISSVVGISFGLKNDRARFGGAVRQAGLEVDWNSQFDGNVNVLGDLTVNSSRVVLTVNSTAPDASGNVNVSGGGGGTDISAERVQIEGNFVYPFVIRDENAEKGLEVLVSSSVTQMSLFDADVERNYIGNGRVSVYDTVGSEISRIAHDQAFLGTDLSVSGDVTIGSGITVSSDATVGGDLTVTGDIIGNIAGVVKTVNSVSPDSAGALTLSMSDICDIYKFYAGVQRVLNVESSYRHVFFMIGGSTNNNCILLANVTSAGAVSYTKLGTGSNITIATATNQIKITVASYTTWGLHFQFVDEVV